MAEIRLARREDMWISDLGAVLRNRGGPLLLPFRLAAECGLEAVELANLRWSDVRLQGRFVMTTCGSKYHRYLRGISTEIADLLRLSRDMAVAHPPPVPTMVCLDSTGKPYTERTLKTDLAALCGELEIPGVGWGTIHSYWLRQHGIADEDEH